MSDTVSRELLLHRLDSVQAGLAGKQKGTYDEQASCFIFFDNVLFTCGNEIACSCPSPLPNFTGAIRPDRFLKMLQNLNEEELGFESDDSHLVLTGQSHKKCRFLLETVSSSVEDMVRTMRREHENVVWRPLPDQFAEAIDVVRQAASTANDDSHFFRVCIHIHPHWLEASDNFQLCRWTMETGVQQDLLVRQQAIRQVVPLGMTEWAESDSWLHFRNPAQLVFSCRRYLVEDQYPDLGHHFEFDGVTAKFNKKLVEAVNRAEIFTSEDVDNNRIRVKLKPGRLTLEGIGVSGDYIEGPKKVIYDGPSIHFLIAPQMFRMLLTNHDSYIVASDRLKVSAGSYKYAVCLLRPEDVLGTAEATVEEKELEVESV
ncbi:MAG: hypothetical protein KGL39_00855 [Patescibacteria group bacterium]|nr:hypothetical protein [Patescibacteria group bacterium]